jgi:hypothetical protein
LRDRHYVKRLVRERRRNCAFDQWQAKFNELLGRGFTVQGSAELEKLVTADKHAADLDLADILLSYVIN